MDFLVEILRVAVEFVGVKITTKQLLMFALKIQSKFVKLVAVFLLAFFVLSKTVALLHAYSHQENGAPTVTKTFLEKIFFGHEKSSNQKSENCFLCAFSNFQNQISLSANLIFSAAVFYFGFTLRKLPRVKLSHLLSSKAARAPPAIS